VAACTCAFPPAKAFTRRGFAKFPRPVGSGTDGYGAGTIDELERKIASLGDLAQARGEREALLAKVESLQGELKSRDQDLAALCAEREREASEATRLRTEREEVRTKVEGLLTEIGRLESVVQGAATYAVVKE
jgi:chromosome segregation ATPase